MTSRRAPPQKGRKSTEFCTNSGRNFGRVQLLIVPPKLKKKMAGAPSCICCFGGSVSAGRVLGTRSHSKTPKKNGERSLLYFLLWGERLRRQSTGFVMTPCLTPRKKQKHVPKTKTKNGRSTLSFIFCGVPKTGQSTGRLSKKTPLTGSGNPKARWRFGACAFRYMYNIVTSATPYISMCTE